MKFKLDPKHETFDLFNDPFVKEVWEKRYKAKGEKDIFATFDRVANAIGKNEVADIRSDFYEVMSQGLFMPAGRILSSAGLDTQSTLQNCYVSGTIEDTQEGIMKAYSEAMVTLSRFGGIGMDFSPIRPKGAKIGNQGLVSPGVMNWMDMWHHGADRIMQSGHRRGAMMGTLAIDHPDVVEFITAKQEAGRLTNFNVSVLVSDQFMNAVKRDDDWHLWHTIPRANDTHQLKLGEYYVYRTMKARELWDMITHNTYEYSEPGVIFIDKINKENNLWYLEDIRCTNPCGEQPLPPFGACNLGHINLGRLVKDPFSKNASIDRDLLNAVVKVAVRFLDNVIDVSNFPLPQQEQEQRDKRRLGLGVSGFHDMLMQMGSYYGSAHAIETASKVMRAIAIEAYKASVELGKERGNFLAFDAMQYGRQGFAKKMKESVNALTLSGKAMRNSLLLTVAPTGTVSVVFGNISSGIEPVFAFRMDRKVYVEGGAQETYTNESFISRFYAHCLGLDRQFDIRDHEWAVTMNEIGVEEQLRIQGAFQEWVDASISKTVSIPVDYSFEDFQKVYEIAYESGCKGTTTYRPSDVRGSVIESADKPKTTVEERNEMGAENHLQPTDFPTNEPLEEGPAKTGRWKRPAVLPGCTMKIKWPGLEDNVYLTVNEVDGRPAEVFIASRDLKIFEWSVVSCILLSRCLARGENPAELASIFQGIQGAHDGQWVEGKYFTSLPQYIGHVLAQHFAKFESASIEKSPPLAGSDNRVILGKIDSGVFEGRKCSKCGSPSIVMQEGCEKCTNCGHSKCS